MSKGITLKSQFTINAPVDKVWEALTNPVLVKQYFFGTDLVTSWKVGAPIFWRGNWEGTAYEDKGVVLEFESNKHLKYSYWSSFAGTPDTPENYANISYDVEAAKGKTLLTITQEGLESAEKQEESEGNWKAMMAEMEKLIVAG